MTPNNPEQSNCCRAPLKQFPNMRDGQTVPVMCSKCDKDCSVYVPYESVRRLPEQTEPEPTQKLGGLNLEWEDELPRVAAEFKVHGDFMQLHAFIRKVEKEAYERGFRECEAQGENESFKLTEKTPEELRGKTNYFLCMKCGEPCNLKS